MLWEDPAWTRLWRNWRFSDPFADFPQRRAPYAAVAALIAIAHVSIAPVANLAVAGGPQALPAPPGIGLDLVILLAFGPRYWPILLAAYFGTSLWRHLPWLPSCGVAVAGTTRTLLAVASVRWVSGMKRLLAPFEDLAGIALAGVVATAVGASLGVVCLAVTGSLPAPGGGLAFIRWWIADALAVFATSPALMVIARSWTTNRPTFSWWRGLQCLLCMTCVALASYLVFFRPDTDYLLFSVFLVILIAAAWLGQGAARIAAAIVSLAAIGATRVGAGAFAAGTLRENLQNLILFLIAVSVTGMAVGAFRVIGSLTLPAGVLLAGWAVSGWLYASMDRGRVTYDQGRLDSVIASAETRIHAAYQGYENLAWDAAAVLAGAGHLNGEEWGLYVSSLHLADRYPGMTVISTVVPSETVDPIDRAAAAQARDSGGAVLTGNAERGLHLFVPVYRMGAPVSTEGERRGALLSCVKVEFGADSLFLPASEDLQNIVGLHVSAGADDLHSARMESITPLTLGGKTWTLRWTPRPGFPYLSRGPFTLAAGCTALLTLLLAGLVLTLQTTRRRASDRWKLLSASALGTWELDFNSGTVHCSEQLLRLYGVQDSRDSISLSDWIGFVHPDDRATVAAQIGDRLATRESTDWQYRVVWPDGSVHWLHSKALPVLDEQGRRNRIVGVDFDISEIKQLQSQLAQAQKLQSVGQLAAGVAHEINTPIQYIGDNGKFLEDAFRDLIRLSEAQQAVGTAAAADDGALEYLRTEVPRAASQLLEGVDQVARIVRAMKEFSHPGPIERSSADINRAIQNTIVVSRNEWKYVAEVTTDLDPDLPPVPCVVGEFNQVILNLIVNAAHAITETVKDSGGKGLIHISTRQKDSMVEVRVSDNGSGIPAAIQSKIFDPFFTTKPVGQGTGQGLAIAHTVIVQKHDGHLTFESEPGRGTTFVIQLPLARELETA